MGHAGQVQARISPGGAHGSCVNGMKIIDIAIVWIILILECLQLTVEDYVNTMEKLITDMRFTIYNICYKRILVIWIVTAFIILLSLLFSGFQVMLLQF